MAVDMGADTTVPSTRRPTEAGRDHGWTSVVVVVVMVLVGREVIRVVVITSLLPPWPEAAVCAYHPVCPCEINLISAHPTKIISNAGQLPVAP